MLLCQLSLHIKMALSIHVSSQLDDVIYMWELVVPFVSVNFGLMLMVLYPFCLLHFFSYWSPHPYFQSLPLYYVVLSSCIIFCGGWFVHGGHWSFLLVYCSHCVASTSYGLLVLFSCLPVCATPQLSYVWWQHHTLTNDITHTDEVILTRRENLYCR